MTKGDLDGRTILGRPFKPVPGGLIVLMLLVGADVRVGWMPVHAPVSAVALLAAAVVMLAAWLPRSQGWYELGLLAGAGAWVSQSVEVALLGQVPLAGVWACMAWITLGTFWLEHTSHDTIVGG